MVEMMLHVRAGWEVSRVRVRSLEMMYMTSSTEEVMYGGWWVGGVWREREVGGSSSWKAFSRERRRKKVVKVVKGVMSWVWIFGRRVLPVMIAGRVSGEVGVADGGGNFRARNRQ